MSHPTRSPGPSPSAGPHSAGRSSTRFPARETGRLFLLADGDIGIGGDPHALVRRCAHLISPTGVLLVEVDNNDVEEHCTAWFEDTHGHRGPPFPWARLRAPALRRITDDLGFSVTDQWKSGPRTFLALGHPGSSPRGRARPGRAMP
ncbi:hypothetical protein ACFWOJ_33760 [Streptomyces sp. NPDC058439]|uniref:hypothetical protein n=1 Tax=Streptomyces sp. NPDC058439 TaxID=3346500 RepID=UPI003661B9D3